MVRENGELRSKLNTQNYTSELKMETIKSNLESKCTILKQQNDMQSDRLKKLDSEL